MLLPEGVKKGIGIDSIYEVHANSPFYKDREWHDMNKPFYQLKDAEKIIEYIIEYIIDGKIERRRELLLNLECDEEIEQQVRHLRTVVLERRPTNEVARPHSKEGYICD